jgi:hypothetical protein
MKWFRAALRLIGAWYCAWMADNRNARTARQKARTARQKARQANALAIKIESRKQAALKSGVPQKILKFYESDLRSFPYCLDVADYNDWVPLGVTIIEGGSEVDRSLEYGGTRFRFVREMEPAKAPERLLDYYDEKILNLDKGANYKLAIHANGRLICEMHVHRRGADEPGSGCFVSSLSGFISGPAIELLAKLVDEIPVHKRKKQWEWGERNAERIRREQEFKNEELGKKFGL